MRLNDMTWHITVEVSLITNKETGRYHVENPVDSLPITIVFYERGEAEKFAKWLNKKDNYIEALETILENVYDENLEDIKKMVR